jgi:hypothetical protein
MTRRSDLHEFFHRKEDPGDRLAERVSKIRTQLARIDPELLAARSGATYDEGGDGGGKLRLRVWDREVILGVPSFEARDAETGEGLDTFTLALVAYYLQTADGTPEAGRCIAFTELPDGKMYTQAFQSYTGHELAKAFGNNVESFGKAAASIGGRPVIFGDRAFSFRALPLVQLTVTCWMGDEDFPPSYRILFDSAVSHHLPTDACAILGSTLTRRLIRAREGQSDRHWPQSIPRRH